MSSRVLAAGGGASAGAAGGVGADGGESASGSRWAVVNVSQTSGILILSVGLRDFVRHGDV